jgi:hypothetical protein
MAIISETSIQAQMITPRHMLPIIGASTPGTAIGTAIERGRCRHE